MDEASVMAMDRQNSAVCAGSPVTHTLQRGLGGMGTPLPSAEGLDGEQTWGSLSIYPPRALSACGQPTVRVTRAGQQQ